MKTYNFGVTCHQGILAKQNAGICFTLGCVSAGVCIVAVIVTFLNDTKNVDAMVVSGAAFSATFIFLFFSQFLYVRAALEKLNQK